MRNLIRLIGILAILFTAWLSISVRNGYAEEQAGRDVIATISVKPDSEMLAKDTQMEIDRLVPLLKKDGEGKMVRIEGSAAHTINEKQRIKQSFVLAKMVANYLRTHHKLFLDTSIGASSSKESSAESVIRIILYPSDFKEVHLSTVGVKAVK